ncbi:DUF4190 domain-containing protein [Amycolatopsis carbonis]|uniref:DUF4190 domain-containing protein n=1 Tax=Amycolatopsis carbonis TaxID=715471 RepID=A0A9Y2IH35_9PSEU|nr:DUF4190 domain-containing protein [Amycolatopsis sp. 2-15]WIX79637.1 DUF4190 domain-containing protein [Amycolatopsis sp. 2-15]
MTNPSEPQDRPNETTAYEPPATADPGSYDPPATADPAPYDPPAGDATAFSSADSVSAASDQPTAFAAPGSTGSSSETAFAAPGSTPTASPYAAPGNTTTGEQPSPYAPPGAQPSGGFAVPGQPEPAAYPGVQPSGAYAAPAYPGQPYPGPTASYPGAHGGPGMPAAAPYGRPYPQQPYGQPYSPYGPQQSNGLAIGALVCSLLGLLTCLIAIPGIVMGHIALAKANRGEAGGRGMALSAVVIGYVIVALYVGFFVTIVILGTNGYLDN